MKPDTVYLHLTKACNLRCAYCYCNAGEPMERELSSDEMLTVFHDISLLNPQKVVFTGGEPLLREDILTLAQAFKQSGSNAHLCLITNGTCVDKGNARDLVENFDEIRISIDGLKDINDALRGKDAFGKAMQAFQWVLTSGGDPVASITITSLNIPVLKEFMYFLLENRIFRIHLAPLKTVGRATDRTMLAHFEDAKKIVEEFWYEAFGLQLQSEHKETFNCGVGKFLTINPDGSVYPCHVLVFPEFCIGNVREQRLGALFYESPLMNTLRNLHFSEIAHCAECFRELPQQGTCLGVCAQERGFRTQLRNVLSEKCAIGI